MPRNPHKTRCAVPGCGAWAMRDQARCHGKGLCRSHLDAKLGSRGAGAPHQNLNALKHGRHAHPLPPLSLEDLVEAAIARPQDLPYQVGLAAHSIQARTGDSFLTLVALRALLPQLVTRTAADLFSAELRDILRPLPPPARQGAQAVIERLASGHPPETRLLRLRKMKNRRKQLVGSGSHQ